MEHPRHFCGIEQVSDPSINHSVWFMILIIILPLPLEIVAFCSRQSNWHCPGAEWQWATSKWTPHAPSLSLTSIPRTDAIVALPHSPPRALPPTRILAVLDPSFTLQKECKRSCLYAGIRRRRSRLPLKRAKMIHSTNFHLNFSAKQFCFDSLHQFQSRLLIHRLIGSQLIAAILGTICPSSQYNSQRNF